MSDLRLPWYHQPYGGQNQNGDYSGGSVFYRMREGISVLRSRYEQTNPAAPLKGNVMDTSAILAIAIREAEDRVYEVNDANGWFEDARTFGEDVALLHSEVSEALEAYREHGFDDATEPERIWAKPEGVGSELADVLIRLLDTSKRRGIDLAYEFERKLAYNKTRGYKHGGKNL